MEERTAASYEITDLSRARAAFSRLGIAVFVMLVITYGVQILAGVALSFANIRNTVMLLVLSYVPMYCIAFPAGHLIMRSVPKHPLELQDLGAGRFFRMLVICFFLMYGGNLFGNLINSVISDLLGISITDPVESLVMSDVPMPALFVLTVILAPFFEELFFRKLLIDRMNVYGQGTAVITTAVMFGLFHGNLSQFFYAMALGLVFGYVYIKTGKLRYTVCMHMIINFWGGIVSGSLVTNESVSALINGGLDPENAAEMFGMITPAVALFFLYTVVTLVLAVAGLVLFFRHRKSISLETAEMQIPKGHAFRTVWLNAGMILFTIACIAMMALTVFKDRLL
ncbi:MAG: CPBP family intramembrane metalloprotease [Clostridia bacterium]|nr:CPBP family intramembrane metalloprotease [Clostridia bacterium]